MSSPRFHTPRMRRGTVVSADETNERILAHRPVGGVPWKAHNDLESGQRVSSMVGLRVEVVRSIQPGGASPLEQGQLTAAVRGEGSGRGNAWEAAAVTALVASDFLRNATGFLNYQPTRRCVLHQTARRTVELGGEQSSLLNKGPEARKESFDETRKH